MNESNCLNHPSEMTTICPICGKVMERTIDFPLADGHGGTVKKTVHVMCDCERKADDAIKIRLAYEDEQIEIQKLKRFSLMDKRLSDKRMCDFTVTPDNEKLAQIMKKYITDFPTMYKSGQGLLLYGPVGTGKSFAAAIIANELIARKTPVVMTSFVKLIDNMKNFDSDSTEIMNRLNLAKLLVIDDFGAERSTDYALEKVYDIIDSRYRSGNPVILTSNVELKDMQNCQDTRLNRIYDRVFEMCYPIKVNGMSWRKQSAVDRFRSMKKLFEE